MGSLFTDGQEGKSVAYYFARFVSWLCCLLPDRVSDGVGTLLGRLTWPLVPSRRRRMAIENVSACLGVEAGEATRIAKASWVRFGPMFLEVMRFPILKPRFLEIAELEGAEYLREGLALGRGVVIATAHSGNWELMGGAFASAGFPVVGVAKRQSSAGMDRFINEYRTLVGMHVTYRSGVREVFRMIDEGWIIGLISDQDPSLRDGVIIDFFGQPTNAFTGAAAIARRCGVPIFPVFIHRESNGHHTVTVEQGIMVEKTDDRAADVRRVTQTVSMHIENWIRRYPEEWFWLHDRWKSLREKADEKSEP